MLCSNCPQTPNPLPSPPLIAACDFDGTLWRSHSANQEDIDAIQRWRAAGNAFGLVTGRGISTLQETLALCPPFGCDFLICNNGALLCDGSGRKRMCFALPDGSKEQLFAHIVLRSCPQCILFSDLDAHVLAGKTPYWIHPENLLPALTAEEAALRPLHQVSIAYPDHETALRWTESLRGVAGIEPHPSRICIDITAKDVSKSNGILSLLELFNWKGEVLAIGDDGNDLPMLKAFTGFAMDTAPDEVKEAARGVFPSVASVLNACL